VSWLDAGAIVGGLVAGVLSGTIGIGGGLAFVPILTIAFRTTQVVAQGTSLAAIVPTALVGGVTHIRQGNVDREAGLLTGLGGAVGAVGGAFVAVHVAGPLLARIFGVLLIASAAIMWRRAGEEPAPTIPPAETGA
jgi:uncharacterized membrane protein YfcA